MKNGLSRILSLILALSIILSMFTVFAYAADDTTTEDETGEGVDEGAALLAAVKEKYPNFEVLYQRDYAEGWDVKNGMSLSDNGSKLNIDKEVGSDFRNNYFVRFEGLSSGHTYLEWKFITKHQTGAVVEFDLKADDYCQFTNFLQGITGNGGTRTFPNLISIEDGQVYVAASYSYANGKSSYTSKPVCSLDEWTHFAIVFDYTYSTYPAYDEFGRIMYDENGKMIYDEDDSYFMCYIYTAPTDEYKKTGELELVSAVEMAGMIDVNNTPDPKDPERTQMGAKGINYLRFQISGLAEADFGTSLCIDNMTIYSGANEYGLCDPAMGYGSSVDETYSKTVEIVGAGAVKKEAKDFIKEGLAMKVGTHYMLAEGKRTPIMTDENGVAYGAPIKIDGAVYVPLLPILDYLNYPYYIRNEGMFVDISTGSSASYVAAGNKAATVSGERVELNAAPGFYNNVLYIDYRDIEIILPGYYGDYDAMGFIAITTEKDVMDRSKDQNTMVDLMKEFIFDYVSAEQVIIDVMENSDNFDHPYLFARQEKFDWLSDIYYDRLDESEYDTRLDGYIDETLRNAKAAYQRYAKWIRSEVRIANTNKYQFVDASGKTVQNVMIDETTGAMTAYDGTAIYLITANGSGYFDKNAKVLVTVKKELPADLTLTTYARTWSEEDYIGLMSDEEILARYGAGEYANASLEMPYQDSYGYDPAGGRSALNYRTLRLEPMAMAWQITGDIKYVLAGFEICLRVCEWTHWGPGHFLNCADGATFVAYFYDWCYDAIMALYNGTDDLDGDGQADFDMSVVNKYLASRGLDYSYFDIDIIYDALYEKAVYEGANACKGINTVYQSPICGPSSNFYHTKPDSNWVAVCSSGMILSSLCLLDKADDQTISEADQLAIDTAAWLISNNIWGLADHGLGTYAPDGSYVESPGYWSYGTNNLFELCMALESAAGTTYGLMDCWGIDTTCDFACAVESSDYRKFNYHDDKMNDPIDTEFFFFVGSYFGNDGLINVRLNHLAGGKEVHTYDLLAYPEGDVKEVAPMALDYFSENLDLYTARSSWEKGALYVGMMGGYNEVSHGQIDAGSFVYHNGGNAWIVDIGTEDYNVYSFGSNGARYRYYRMKPEGNNTIAISSEPKEIPYGQEQYAGAEMIKYDSNEYGSYAILDMTATLNGKANYWYRGMMVTNDRKTTIIQDEITFAKGVYTAYWFAHFQEPYVTGYKLSSNGKTAYLMSSNKDKVLRVSIICANSKIKFEVWDAYTYVHNQADTGTVDGTFSTDHGKSPEYSREGISKLVIEAENVAALNMAVVIEEIDAWTMDSANEIDLGYSYIPSKGDTMLNWEPTTDKRAGGTVGGGAEVDSNVRGKQNPSTIIPNARKLDGYFAEGKDFRTDLDMVYYVLTDLEYVVAFFRSDTSILSNYKTQVNKYKEYKAIYDAFVDGTNSVIAERASLAEVLMGL